MIKILAIFILLFTSSCLSRIDNEGYSFELSDYEMIKEEITSKNEVRNIMGLPSVISFIGEDPIWIYFSQKKKRLLFFKPKITERKIMTIKFDKKQKFVEKIDFYDLDDQKNVKYISDYTKIENPNKNIFLEFFGNIGKISPN
jgi:outer membrane protein assembly factor BamE (lipoprotein component of BamABCDE complex)